MRLLLAALLVFTALTGTPAHAAEASDDVLTFVLLREPKLPDAKTVKARLEQRLRARVKGQMTVTEVEPEAKAASKAAPASSEPEVMLFRVAGGTAMVGVLDRPLPDGQVDDLCAAAWFWKTACADAAQHRAQLIVSLLGTKLDRLDRALLLTDLTAALLDGNDNAIASYWMSALRPRDMFVKASSRASRDLPPVWLWVDFRISGGPQGVSMSTEGMNVYDLRELEAKDVKRPASEVLSLITGTATYLVSKGPVIKDGDTIGDSPSLGIVVRHDKSYWRDGQDVYRVVWTK